MQNVQICELEAPPRHNKLSEQPEAPLKIKRKKKHNAVKGGAT